eukprot:CAMPEP_0113849788 /NCGR_PEP_ID=MMETSP0372-20130328/3387_1 /TAXON_ID=340204 /ORGANISM="Lankesteria abbotti" /LENGTH=281 /DNA_ID=CAMNT_0000819741 /DNA_START=136 /DNA_END=981 /DNA_ORIENTATION=+ /assembly_acc=CAM_ASM_000359
MDPNSPEAWFKNMPKLTRVMACATFAVTVFSVLQLIDITLLLLNWQFVIERLQIWRLFTDFFFIGKFSFSWIFTMYFLITFSSKLEQNEIFSSSTPGAYLYFILIQMLTLDCVSGLLFWPTGKMVMGPSLHFAIIYYWSRREPWAPVGLWGFTLAAYQFPFALLLLDVLMGGSVWGGLMGLFSGHLYYYLREILPAQHSVDLLSRCPKMLDNLVVSLQNFSPSSVYTQQPRAAPTATGPRQPATLLSSNQSSSPENTQPFPRPTAAGQSGFSGRGYRLSGD